MQYIDKHVPKIEIQYVERLVEVPCILREEREVENTITNTILYYTILYYTILYYTILYYTIL